MSNAESFRKKKKKLSTFSDRVAPVNDFTNNTVVQCECNVSSYKVTFVNDGNIQMIRSKF